MLLVVIVGWDFFILIIPKQIIVRYGKRMFQTTHFNGILMVLWNFNKFLFAGDKLMLEMHLK